MTLERVVGPTPSHCTLKNLLGRTLEKLACSSWDALAGSRPKDRRTVETLTQKRALGKWRKFSTFCLPSCKSGGLIIAVDLGGYIGGCKYLVRIFLQGRNCPVSTWGLRTSGKSWIYLHRWAYFWWKFFLHVLLYSEKQRADTNLRATVGCRSFACVSRL